VKIRDIEVGGGLRVHATCAVGHYYKWESTEFFNKVTVSSIADYYSDYLGILVFFRPMTLVGIRICAHHPLFSTSMPTCSLCTFRMLVWNWWLLVREVFILSRRSRFVWFDVSIFNFFTSILGTHSENWCGDLNSSPPDGNTLRGQRVIPQRARRCHKPPDHKQQVSQVPDHTVLWFSIYMLVLLD